MVAKKALVTGANGCLGRALIYRLGMDWERIGTIHKPERHHNVPVCDITDAAQVLGIVQQTSPDVIFHTVALTPAAAPKATQEDFMRVNVDGTRNLLEAVRQYAPQARVILVTSSAMYGIPESNDGIIDEESELRPVNAYGVSKATQHLLGYQYFAQYKLDVIRACPFNLIGNFLPKGLVASDFAAQIAAIERGKQEPVIQVGDLSGKRDFLDAYDAADGLIALIEAGKAGESYNLASGQAVSIRYLLDELLNISTAEIEVRPRANITPNPVPIQIGSHDKLTQATGWQPQTPFKISLAYVLGYWRSVRIEETL